MHNFRVFIILIGAFLVGCTTQMPSIEDSIFTAASLVEQTAETTVIAFDNGTLSVEDAREISDFLDKAAGYVALAKKAYLLNDMNGAMEQLSAALQFLEKAKLLETRP
jgi:hypothetical protein